jgi:hypothetical protein
MNHPYLILYAPNSFPDPLLIPPLISPMLYEKLGLSPNRALHVVINVFSTGE